MLVVGAVLDTGNLVGIIGVADIVEFLDIVNVVDAVDVIVDNDAPYRSEKLTFCLTL